jgi:ATP/ADP translocase
MTIGINLFCTQILTFWPEFIFFHYAWKDIYILLMFKQLWSMIHSTIPSAKAKLLYGSIFGMGTIGSILGSLFVAKFAVDLGSEQLFSFTLPLYAILMLAYGCAYRRSTISKSPIEAERTPINMIRKSPYLMGALLVVVFMQISSGLMEFRFNSYLEQTIFDKDLRTAYCGRLIGITNTLSLLLQFVGGFLMVRILGVRGSHIFVPALLCCNLLLPIPVSFAVLKSVDFSLFSVIREMLYIPMKLDEKFRAKAIIDVFAYRSSKALVSLLVLFCPWIGSLSIAVFILWIGVVVYMFRQRENYENQPARR